MESDSSLRYQPDISYVSQDILKIQTYAGTEAGSCRYYNVKNREKSEWYPVIPLTETDRLFAYIDCSKSKLVVQDIFTPSKYYKTFPVEVPYATAGGFSAQFIDSNKKIKVIRDYGDNNPKVYTFAL